MELFVSLFLGLWVTLSGIIITIKLSKDFKKESK